MEMLLLRLLGPWGVAAMDLAEVVVPSLGRHCHCPESLYVVLQYCHLCGNAFAMLAIVRGQCCSELIVRSCSAMLAIVCACGDCCCSDSIVIVRSEWRSGLSTADWSCCGSIIRSNAMLPIERSDCVECCCRRRVRSIGYNVREPGVRSSAMFVIERSGCSCCCGASIEYQ